ncbi:tetratricopeptide repeat protein [Rubrolithibacter danxiaensis]|uniref:tetratricopeptide repeat protein n=1 Tax=Rubrolithibacter danxiaensis TaxID=3390805 RepID=UPI003BF7C5C4
MKIKHILILLLAGICRTNSSSAFSAINPDSVSLSAKKPVKIGPQEMGILLDSAVIFKMQVDARFNKMTKDAASFKNYKEFQSLYSFLSFTETFQTSGKDAEDNLKKTLALYKSEDNYSGLVLINNSLAVLHANKGDFEKSVQFFNDAKRLCEQKKDKQGIASINENLAAVYKVTGQYDKAIILYEENTKINSAIQKPNVVAEDYLKIADLKSMKGEYTQAEYYILKKAFPLFRRMGNKVGRMNCFESLAFMYRLQNKLSEAKWFSVQSKIMADKLNNLPAQISSLMSLAFIKSELGFNDQALADYKEAEKLAADNNFSEYLVEIKGNMGDVYRKLGNYLAANTSIDEYYKLKENLFNTSAVKVF